jgi:tetratricopeptide (TPR) repeat protein
MNVNFEASTWFDLGCELDRVGRHEEALSAFLQAQELDLKIPNLQQALAAAYFGLKKYPESLALLEVWCVKNQATQEHGLI